MEVNLPTKEYKFLLESNHIEEEWSEIALQDAIRAWKYIRNKKKLSLTTILKTHALLMTTRPCDASWKGKPRTGQATVGGKEMMDYKFIRPALATWIDAVNQAVEYASLTTVVFIKKHHVAFEEIHPFFDGNGRIGRILMNWERKQVGLPIKIITYEDRGKYYEWFE